MAKAPAKDGPIRLSLKFSQHGGFAGLAKKLQDDFASVTWPQGKRSLETQLDKLDKGITVWWQNKPEHAGCLAKLLEVELLDLGLTGERARHIVEFTNFPGMPPLDLKRDDVWLLGSEKPDRTSTLETDSLSSLEEWFSPSPWMRRPPSGRDWLCVEDDLEQLMLTKKLEAMGRYDVAFAETLSDVSVRLSSTKPLVVVVRELGGEEDYRSLALRPDGAGILVVAPCLPSIREATSSHEFGGWERMGLQGRERVAFDLSANGTMGDIKRWTWEHHPDWRSRLLLWVERHFDRTGRRDTLYTAAGTMAWLERFDPQAQWFQTPTDLLSLCLGFEGEKKLPREHDSQAGHKLLKALQRNQPAFPSNQLTELCLARWRCARLPWLGAMSLDEWGRLVPLDQGALNPDDLDAIVNGKTALQIKQAAETLRQRVVRASPELMVKSGLLKRVGSAYEFRHRSLVNLLIRDQLLDDMRKAPLSVWAWTCFDTARCRFVDAALDAMPLTEIHALAIRVAEQDTTCIESIGVSEAIFCAVGRRIARGESISPMETFMSVAQRVIVSLDRDDVSAAMPAPRSRALDSEREQLAWISACWAWSLMPRPSSGAPGCWLFPGWSDALPEAPWWIACLWPDKDISQLPEAWQLFFRVIDEWIKDVDVPLPEVPRVLLLAYLAKAARGGWAAQPVWWQELIHRNNHPWINQALIERFGRAGRTEAARRLWPSFVRFESGAHDSLQFIYHLSSVRRWMLESLPAISVIESLDAAEREYLALCPHTLPPEARGPLLLSFVETGRQLSLGEEVAFIRHFGPSVADELHKLLGRGFVLGLFAASLLWEWNSERAKDLLLNAKDLSQKAWVELFSACPSAYLSIAIDAIQANPAALDLAERQAWVKQKLPGSGGLAPRLMALVQCEAQNF